jgi:hypothetical protein
VSRENLALDPSCLAPQAAPSATAAHALVRTGVTLSRLSKEPWINLLLARDAPWVLERDGFLPLFPAVSRLLCDAGIEEYDAPTVVSVLQGTLQRAGSLERESCFKDVLFENFSSNPDISSNAPGPALMQERQREALICALAESCGRGGAFTFLVPDAPGSAASVSALLHDAEHECSAPRVGAVVLDVRLVRDVEMLIRSFRFGTALCLCESAEQAVRCIEYGVRQARLRAGRNCEDPFPQFRVGGRFLEIYRSTVGDRGASLAEKAMRAMAECVEATAVRNSHALRTGPEPTAPRRMRGGDSGCRADIDYEFHLHYWKCTDGYTEFASVGPHNDFSIPE